ncbi:aldo/keto reductase [Saxibacter everestensis]|uniref:Aldo/keto reductase n=1 Tax=Saxibacter everestensis TaxID=2909229 RepID=A0ABY8QXA5_9MICO|nr:aldo/keto reductase [Brevibacteriaceae bacterium ZFBP1038]
MYVNYAGRSGLRVSTLGLGTMTWGRGVPADAAAELVRTFVDAGGNLIDTSFAYGVAQQMVGDIISSKVDRDDLVLVSKAGISPGVNDVSVDCSRRGLMAQLDQTLQTLGTDHLDLWLVEAWDSNVPLEETLSVLAAAQRSGRTRYVGVANYSGWQSALAVSASEVPLVAAEVEYSLLQRTADAELLPAAEHLGIGVLASSALGRGVLTGKYRHAIPRDSRAASSDWSAFVGDYLNERDGQIVEAVTAAASGLNFSPLAVALSWLASHSSITSAIVGPRTVAQLNEILDGIDADVPDEILAALDEVSQ